MPPGLLFVASTTTQPSLSADDFNAWYENQHIYEVTATSGIPRACRYEAYFDQEPPIEGIPVLLNNTYPWLTCYDMNDVNFRNTDEFKNLDGQSDPSDKKVLELMRRARFETRFYEEIERDEREGAEKGPATLMITAGLQPSSATEADFNAWYTEEHMPLVSKAPGYVRTRRYKLVGATNLNEYNRQQSDAPSYLAIHEFDSNSFPNAELRKCDETPWSEKVFKGLEKMEVGFYRRKRVYKEGEQPGAKL